MKRLSVIILALIALIAMNTVAPAQDLRSMLAQNVTLDYYLPDTCSYNKNIPTPKQFFGYEIGEFQTLHENAVAYIKAVAEKSDRVKLFVYGYTHEKKPLYLVVFSSPENIRNLEQLRSEHVKLCDPDENPNTANMPVFTWLGHSIHGNETSGFNASLLLIYHLAAAGNAETLKWLENEVIIIDPAINPDGIDRFSEWANYHRSLVPNNDNQQRELSEAWPGGRFNHYWFDLNRDWLNQVHPESQGRAVALLEWRPNVYTCAHEQGTNANYHFSPGAPTRVHPLIPDECQNFIKRLARDYYAPAFNRQKMLYFSGEVYDDYYLGRGREYIDFHGGIALLWEQPSSRGFLQSSVNGDVAFPLTIHNQLTAELATLRGSCDMRQELLDYQKQYFKNSLKEAPGTSYVFGSENDYASAVRFAELISRNGVKVYKLGSSIKAGGKEFTPEYSFVVPQKQKQYRLVEGIFEIRREYKDSISYDITGWTMPFAFNLAYANVAGAGKGEEFSWKGEKPVGQFFGNKEAYAYIFSWGGFYAPRALYRLLSNGVYAKVSSAVIKAPDREFPRGSVMIPLGANYQKLSVDQIYSIVQEITAEDMIDVYSYDGGFFEEHNLGSGVFYPVRTPHIAAIGGQGASAASTGALWNLLDREYHIPCSVIPAERIGSLELSRYNVLYVTGAFGDMSAAGIAKITEWVKTGGTLIATEGGFAFLKKAGLTDAELKQTTPRYDVAYEDFSVVSRAQNIAGVIFNTEIDITHPLCWGYVEKNLPVFKNNALMLKPLENTLRTPAVHTQKVLLSGNALRGVQDSLARTPVALVSKAEQGRVIYYTIDPNFRGIWYGTSKLTANAIFFGHLINSRTL